MSSQMLTLFDLEPIEQPQKAVPKKVVPKRKSETEKETEEETVSVAEKKAEKPKVEIVSSELSKTYYSIGETAKMFSVRTSHIRFWTVQFALKIRTNRKGDRLYSPENIELLKTINQLVKVEGFTIAGAKAKLKELKKTKLVTAQKPKQSDVKAALNALRDTLLDLRKKL